MSLADCGCETASGPLWRDYGREKGCDPSAQSAAPRLEDIRRVRHGQLLGGGAYSTCTEHGGARPCAPSWMRMLDSGARGPVIISRARQVREGHATPHSAPPCPPPRGGRVEGRGRRRFFSERAGRGPGLGPSHLRSRHDLAAFAARRYGCRQELRVVGGVRARRRASGFTARPRGRHWVMTRRPLAARRPRRI